MVRFSGEILLKVIHDGFVVQNGNMKSSDAKVGDATLVPMLDLSIFTRLCSDYLLRQQFAFRVC